MNDYNNYEIHQSKAPPVDYIVAEAFKSPPHAASITPPSMIGVRPPYYHQNPLTPQYLKSPACHYPIMTGSILTCTPWTTRSSDLTPQTPPTVPCNATPDIRNLEYGHFRNLKLKKYKSNTPDCDFSPNAYSNGCNNATSMSLSQGDIDQSGDDENITSSVRDSEDDDEETQESLSIGTILHEISCTEEDLSWARRGFEKTRKLCDTLQGVMYLAVNTRNNGKKVAIKKASCKLHREGISIENGMSIVVDENIVKEAGILRYLTMQNNAIGDYVVKFVDFFKTHNSYFLCIDYIEQSITLGEYIRTVHHLIREKILSKRKHLRIMKYILWQISVALYWLHTDMSCTHLDLCSENVLVRSTFQKTKAGNLLVSDKAHVKLVDFGCAEVFKDNDFQCDKFATGTNREQYLAPKVFTHCEYDARTADMWALGIIVYEGYVGCKPFETIPPGANSPDNNSLSDAPDCSNSSRSDANYPVDSENNGYWAIYGGNVREHFMNNKALLDKLSWRKPTDAEAPLDLLVGLLDIKGETRLSASQVLLQKLFKSYYKIYYSQIEQWRAANRKK